MISPGTESAWSALGARRPLQGSSSHLGMMILTVWPALENSLHPSAATASAPSQVGASAARAQDSVEASMCPSKTDIGTTAAFPVPAAPPPWWAKALYQTEIKFYARAAAKQAPEWRILTLLFPKPRLQDFGAFSEPLLGPNPSLERALPQPPLPTHWDFRIQSPNFNTPQWYSPTQAPKSGLLWNTHDLSLSPSLDSRNVPHIKALTPQPSKPEL